MRVLMVSPFLPYPPDKGTSIRNWNLIRRLAGVCQFSLLALINSPDQRAFVPQMQQLCPQVETILLERKPKWKHLPGIVGCLAAGQPPMNTFLHIDELAHKVRQYTHENDFDLVQIEGSCMAPYIECIAPESRARTALTFIDIESIKLRRRLAVETSFTRVRTLVDWAMMTRWEARYAERFDLCLTMSELDAQVLSNRNPRLNVHAVPNGVDTDAYKPLPANIDSQVILLVGYLYHSPWEDAVLYFHREVFPYVQRELPTARLLIVGEPTPRVRALESEAVTVAGYVDDVRPYYERSALSVVPLRAAGGTRLKILESMALGRPVVSTSIGCEGLQLTAGEHLLVADDAQELARHTVRLMKDRQLWQRLVQRGRALVEAEYGWDRIAARLLATYETAIGAIHSERIPAHA